MKFNKLYFLPALLAAADPAFAQGRGGIAARGGRGGGGGGNFVGVDARGHGKDGFIEIRGQTIDTSTHTFAEEGFVTFLVGTKAGVGAKKAESGIKSTLTRGGIGARTVGEVAKSFRNGQAYAVNVYAQEAAEVMDALEALDDVAAVELDTPMSVPEDGHEDDAAGAAVGGKMKKPKLRRELAEEQPYGIPMVLNGFAHDGPLPSGAQVKKVCVVDTGYDLNHPDLPVAPHVDGTTPSWYGGQNWHTDGHGHGTHCAGTIAAIKDNDLGVFGVIPGNFGNKFQVLVQKGLTDSGSGSLTGVMAAVAACVEQGANVVSMSLGGGGFSQTSSDLYNQYYKEDGVLFVAAAGNGGNSAKSYPASYSAVMSVAAIDSNKNRATFSQHNNQVEISGPGKLVKSTLPRDNAGVPQYAAWSGTSMACPHVAGVAGLLWLHHPTCSVDEIRRALLVSAGDLGAVGCDDYYGTGVVDMKKADDYLQQEGCTGNMLLGGATYGGCAQLNAYIPPAPTPPPTPCPANADHIKVEIKTDNYGSETSWDLKHHETNDEVLSGSGYSSNTEYSELTVACYSPGAKFTYTINDSYGDGICCSYGTGFYKVSWKSDTLAEGGEFGDSEDETFTLEGETSQPTSPSPSPSPSPFAPSPSPTPEPVPTTTAPTFLTCSHYNKDECLASDDCQWIGDCHNCGCVRKPHLS